MDTPGILNRPDAERNEMEALTLASMQHLPTAVMFVLDLTGHSGSLSSIENQIQIRNDLRKRFPKRPWVDVISKADLPVDADDPSVALVSQGAFRKTTDTILISAILPYTHHTQAPEGAIMVSTTDGTGIPELESRVREMLNDVREILELYQMRPPAQKTDGPSENKPTTS